MTRSPGRAHVALGQGRGRGIPAWLRGALAAAGTLGLLWGLAVVLWPHRFFEHAGLAAPTHAHLLQTFGAYVAIVGLGTIIASHDPLRHWPVVLISLLAKVVIPVGGMMLWMQGELPGRAVAALLINDVVWWAPFAMVLWHAARDFAAGDVPRSPIRMTPRDAMAHAVSNDGESLLELSESGPRLVVFLRHGGCTFCKEALADLHKQRGRIEATGTGIVLVHMGMPDEGEDLILRSGLEGVPVISDPLRQLYQAFQLDQGTFVELFGPKVVLRGISATLRGHLLTHIEGDALQMPGVFVVSKGAILRSFRHHSAADRPDYVAIACGDCDFPSPSAA